MKLTRLRIVGFKTFVEPTDVAIEPGLTGIVGPNGCGKSNLVEALRWVMGESSHKNMRASGMDDVIFGGSGLRAARNTAEVTLTIANDTGTAPAAFNDAEILEVSRRIERQSGSTYQVNGRDVRARDVQLLFADAATGARSPSLVRQGQISELIHAKPQARRRILEDAAGVAGLRARRHEAELRLRQAEDNLVRVEDILREIEAQADSLRRQGRQAARYRVLSAEIRKLEAVLLSVAYLGARGDLAAAELAAGVDRDAVARHMDEQGAAAREQALAAHALQPLRQAESAAAAALRGAYEARTALDHEESRAKERLADAERRIAELSRDIARAAAAQNDAVTTIARLTIEAEDLGESDEDLADRRETLADLASDADADLVEAEGELARIQAEIAEGKARRTALETVLRGEADRIARYGVARRRLESDLAAAKAAASGDSAEPLREALAIAEAASEEAEIRAEAAREQVAGAREAERGAGTAFAAADRVAQGFETELRTLTKLFSAGTAKSGTSTMLDQVSVAPGYETAIGAALGDDLDASPDPTAPFAWHDMGEGPGDPTLPAGATPLSDRVTGPAALTRRLKQIGLVAAAEGARLATMLRPGQRLVSSDGDLWRWDGLRAAAEAPSAAARRLAERNRLAALEGEAGAARELADAARVKAQTADEQMRALATTESSAIEAARVARRRETDIREQLQGALRRETESAARLANLTDAIDRIAASEREALGRRDEAEATLAASPVSAAAERELALTIAAVSERRRAAADARAAFAALTREAEMTARRRASLANEIRSWTERAERAAATAGELDARVAEAAAERDALAASPDSFVLRRRAVLAVIAEAETLAKEAAERVAAAETALAAAEAGAKAALATLSAARERKAASEVRAEAMAARLAEVMRLISETTDTDPAGLLQLAGLTEAATPPETAATESRLTALKAERERLGGVNLRAEDELNETEDKRDKLAAERDDLTEAIKRLRTAISSLNREGRERLAAAFDVVNGHFQRLFTTLFGGGSAELLLVDSDDPLEAGLEITAMPPGKKPQSLVLLSGGEQALTATALIFAVFLTNPSPICVLDEVDAPLDDSNVERYCDLLRAMAGETDTRFVVITHNPITMARMDRLFGVTMAERGVSQLVSVDLQAAERILDAS